jgi:ATP-dependent Clp protease ATP-binding subunit ClpA
VGKKRLMRSLARILEEQWEVEVPIHLLEGSRPGRPDEAGEPGGLLDEFLRRASRRPVSILIVDSVEEAHPRLQQLCLTLLQRGTLHDDRGRSLRLDGGLVAFTARAGSGSATESEAPGRRRGKPREGDSPAGGAFRPEIRSRLQVLQFSPLSRRSKSALLEREVWPIFERFRSQQGVEMVLTDRARARLLKLGFSEARGAMDLAATVWRHCALEVTRRLLRDRSSRRDARKETVRDLRIIRAGGRPFDPAAWEQRVRRLARIPVPYRRMIIDERDGEFRYSGQESR